MTKNAKQRFKSVSNIYAYDRLHYLRFFREEVFSSHLINVPSVSIKSDYGQQLYDLVLTFID